MQADLQLEADRLLNRHGYDRNGAVATDTSESIEAVPYGLVASTGAIPLVANIVADVVADYVPLHHVIRDGNVRLAIDCAVLSEREGWTALQQSRPFGPRATRSNPYADARTFVFRQGALQQLRSLTIDDDGHEQGDIWNQRVCVGPLFLRPPVIETWPERVLRLRRKAGRKSASKRAAGRTRQCGHSGPAVDQRSADGTWACDGCRRSFNASQSQRRRLERTEPERTAASLQKIREREDREADALQRLADQRRRMAMASGDLADGLTE